MIPQLVSTSCIIKCAFVHVRILSFRDDHFKINEYIEKRLKLNGISAIMVMDRIELCIAGSSAFDCWKNYFFCILKIFARINLIRKCCTAALQYIHHTKTFPEVSIMGYKSFYKSEFITGPQVHLSKDNIAFFRKTDFSVWTDDDIWR